MALMVPSITILDEAKESEENDQNDQARNPRQARAKVSRKNRDHSLVAEQNSKQEWVDTKYTSSKLQKESSPKENSQKGKRRKEASPRRDRH